MNSAPEVKNEQQIIPPGGHLYQKFQCEGVKLMVDKSSPDRMLEFRVPNGPEDRHSIATVERLIDDTGKAVLNCAFAKLVLGSDVFCHNNSNSKPVRCPVVFEGKKRD
ncbi:MAG: hypothetical protein WCV62_03690 [Candidatus Peribacteraceae bacterium]|jgi:hypothetical protein